MPTIKVTIEEEGREPIVYEGTTLVMSLVEKSTDEDRIGTNSVISGVFNGSIVAALVKSLDRNKRDIIDTCIEKSGGFSKILKDALSQMSEIVEEAEAPVKKGHLN